MCQNGIFFERADENALSGIILAHIPYLMGADFYVWCGICAKYLAFGTYLTSTMGALRELLGGEC